MTTNNPQEAREAKAIAAAVVQSACETDPADPDHPETILISCEDLESLVRTHVECADERTTLSDMGETARMRETSSFRLVWRAAPRPPVHTDSMTGMQNFASFDKAVSFMAKQTDDAQFVSLTEIRTAAFDRSTEARAALGAS